MQVLADAKQVAKLIDQLAKSIAQDVGGPDHRGQWALVGVRSRGDVLAHRLAKTLKPDHVGTLDITLYRDDLAGSADQPMVRTTEIPFAIDGLDVVLVDDVLMTGRSIRAALQVLMDLGRPRRVWLSVLVDRSGRELPIGADHVALDLTGKVAPGQLVAVSLKPTDDNDAVELRDDERDDEDRDA